MGMSAEHARAVFAATGGRDPLFAPVDGANCPNQVTSADTSAALPGSAPGSARPTDPRAAHSLLLDKGLFRIFLPLPTQAEYTLEVLSDPNGCNTDSTDNQEVDPITGEVTRIVSVYRRPLMSSNLKFKTSILQDYPNAPPAFSLITGKRLMLTVDPFSPMGFYESLNIMWDGREPTLQSQAIDAVLIHSQATTPPTSEQVAQMVAFENGIFSAQERLGPVTLSKGANGGAVYLSAQSPSEPPTDETSVTPVLTFDEFDAWANISPATYPTDLQASIARGQTIFNTFQFNFTLGTQAGVGCRTCHSQNADGASNHVGSQVVTGVGGGSVLLNGPAPDPSLPIFKLTCKTGTLAGTDGAIVIINDPGLALITGKCVDIGAFTIPTLRGLAARAPYFHDGSAATIPAIVDFYDKRFSIGFTEQQKQDLVNFLKAL
jgi:cytochrome c peroxidase